MDTSIRATEAGTQHTITGSRAAQTAADWESVDEADDFLEYNDSDGLGYDDSENIVDDDLPTLDEKHIAMLAAERIEADTAVLNGTRSVRSRNDLPKSLRSVWDGRGILFTHHRLDGTTVPQYRPDSPSIRGKSGKIIKYWLPAGSGSKPYVSPLQTTLVGQARRVWVIEGTKAFLAVLSLLVATNRTNDVLAVCLTGCTGGRKDGFYDQDFIKVIPKGSQASVFFDADVKTNPNVNLMAVQLQDFIKKTCRAEAKFAEVPAYGANGVSDWMGYMNEQTDLDVLDMVETVEREALAKIPRIAAAARKTVRVADATTSVSGYKVSWRDECISRPFIENGKEQLGEKIMDGAAFRLKAAYEVYDDLSEKAVRQPMFDLEVKVGGQTHDLEKIPAAALGEPRLLLSMLPHAVGETISVKPRMGEEVGEAIRVSAGRAGAELPVKRMLTRSGWYNRPEVGKDGTITEVPRFVTLNGAIGPIDFVPDLTGRIAEPTFAKFNVVDPHSFTRAEHVDAVKDLLSVGDSFLVDPAPWIVGYGFMAMTACGVANLGGAVLVGVPGSGKSRLIQGLSTAQVPLWIDPANFEGTKNFVADIGSGCENVTVFADDIRVRGEASKSAEEQKEAFEALMRRVYEGGGRSKGRKIRNKLTGDIEQGEKMTNSPGFIFAAENDALPDGVDTTGAINSSMTRAMFIQVTEESTFYRGKADELREMAEAGVFHLAHMGFIAHIAWFKEFRGNAYHLEGLKNATGTWKSELERRFPGLPMSRSYEIAANALVGYTTFLDYAIHIGAIDAADHERREEAAIEIIGRVMKDSWTNFQGGSRRQGYLGRLVSAVVSGSYYIEGLGEGQQSPSQKCLGKVGDVSVESGLKKKVVHILADEAVKILAKPGAKGVGNAIGQSLAAVLNPSKDSSRALTRRIRFRGGMTDAYSVDLDAWMGVDEGADKSTQMHPVNLSIVGTLSDHGDFFDDGWEPSEDDFAEGATEDWDNLAA